LRFEINSTQQLFVAFLQQKMVYGAIRNTSSLQRRVQRLAQQVFTQKFD